MGTKAEYTFLTELNQFVMVDYPEAIDLMPDADDPDPGAKVREMGARFAALEQRVHDLIVPRRCKKLHLALVRFSKQVGKAPPLAQRMVAAHGIKKNILAGRLIAILRLSKRAYHRLKKDAINFDNK